MYGSPAFAIVTTGSHATSGAANQLLFGSYGGLSTLNNSEVVNIQVAVSGLDLMLGNTTVSNNIGLPISAATSVFDLPPLRAGDASLLYVARRTGDNASYIWTIWRGLALTSY